MGRPGTGFYEGGGFGTCDIWSVCRARQAKPYSHTPFERHRVGIPPCGGPGVVVVLRGLQVLLVEVVLGARRAAAACQRMRAAFMLSLCLPGAGQ